MNFTVVRSSAGSGKTYTLVRKYLLLILGIDRPNYFRHILAITFTNKATNEMKVRVVEALEGLSKAFPKYNTLLFDLANELNVEKEVVSRRAETILNNLIHNYSDFSISTIDRFVSRIIKSFSFELNVPSGFEIELDQQRIIQKSIDSLLDKVTNDKELKKLLVSFADYKFSSNKSFHLESDLIEIAKEINSGNSKHFIQILQKNKDIDFAELRKEVFATIRHIESQATEQAKNLIAKIQDLGIEEEELAGGKRGIYSYLNKLSKSGKELKPLPAVAGKIIETENWKSSKTGVSSATLLDQYSHELTEDLKNLAQLIEQNWQHYNFAKLMTMRLDLMSIINEIATEINAFKGSNNLLQLEDFNEQISALINDSPVPYIYERTGEKFNHYLIDEFQDTSQIQWYNLIPLIDESLSKGNESLIVGDEKQAIYRFRGGDVNQMGRLPKLNFDGQLEENYKDREVLLEKAFKQEVLTNNFRSSKAVVDFINEFFQVIKEKHSTLTTDIYKNHKQNTVHNDVEGSVHIKFLEPRIEEELRLDQMKIEIDAFLSIGYNLGDIAILCRKGKQCSSVANYLMQHDYAVFSSESLKLSSSEEVQFLLNWLRLSIDLDKKELEYSILNYLVKNETVPGFTNEELVGKWTEGDGFQNILTAFYSGFKIEELFSKSILEIVTELTDTFLRAENLNPFVLGFVDKILRFQEQHGNDRLEFMRWWDEKGHKVDVEMPAQNDSIQVLTIHKSKGLEFNVVVIPFMDESIMAGKDNLWVETKEKDQAILPLAWLPMNQSLKETKYEEEFTEEMNKSFIDSLNVMYVALTRAAHHISILSTNQKKKENAWREDNLLWSCFLLKEYTGSEESAEFFKGNLSKYESKKFLMSDNSFEIKSVSKYNWRRNIELKFKSDDISLSETALSAQAYGNLFHEIMSKVIVKSDLPKALDFYIKSTAITQLEANKMLEIIELTFSNNEISKFYMDNGYAVYNEREILSINKELLRPDRMMIKDNELVLIDYKTGRLDQTHETQIHTYIKALNQLSDYSISAFLVYFNTKEVRKVA